MKYVARTDQRRCAIESAPEAERIVVSRLGQFTRLEADLARALAEIEKKRSYLLHGARSVQEWAEGRGYGPRQVYQLLALGRSLWASPALEEKVRSGKVTTESAAQVGRVLTDQAVRKAGVDETEWIHRAESLPPRQLRDATVAAIEQARSEETTVPIHLRVTRTARDGFRHARVLHSRGRRKLATEGETFRAVVECYLDHHDPERKPLPARRAGRAANGRGRRIPPRVVAQLERRSGGRCELCGERRAVEIMHLRVPHAAGGTRELDNLAHACHPCHTLADSGCYELSGLDAQNRPVWSVHPERLHEVRERSPPYGLVRGLVNPWRPAGCRRRAVPATRVVPDPRFT